MHKYRVRFKYNTDSNGGCRSETAEITYPKMVYALTDVYGSDGKGRNEILFIAATSLGLDPSRVEAVYNKNKLDGGWYELRHLGPVNKNSNTPVSNSQKPNARDVKPDESAPSYDSGQENLVSNWTPHPDMPDHIKVVTPDKLFLYSDKSDYWANHPQGKSNQKKFKQTLDRLAAEAEQEKKEKIAKLKAEGHGLRAFALEFKSGIIATVAVLGLLILFLVIFRHDSAAKQDAMQIHSELELIEDSVNLCILNNQFDKALVYVNKLKHPMHEDMEQMEFDAWNGYPKYDEYWTKKREEYKAIIFNQKSPGTVGKETEKPKKQKPNTRKDNSVRPKTNNTNSGDNTPSQEDELDDEYKY